MAEQRYNAQASVDVDLTGLDSVGNRAQAILNAQKAPEIPLTVRDDVTPAAKQARAELDKLSRTPVGLNDRVVKDKLRGISDQIDKIDRSAQDQRDLELETSDAANSLETIATMLGSIVSMAAGIVVTLNARQAREELQKLEEKSVSLKEKMFTPGRTMISAITGAAVGAWTVGAAMTRESQTLGLGHAIDVANQLGSMPKSPEQLRLAGIDIANAKDRLFLAEKELEALRKRKQELASLPQTPTSQIEKAQFDLGFREAEFAVTSARDEYQRAQNKGKPREFTPIDKENIQGIIDNVFLDYPAITKGEAMVGAQRGAMLGLNEKQIERMLMATSDLAASMAGSKTWMDALEAMFDALNGDMMRMQEFGIANDPTQFSGVLEGLGITKHGIAKSGAIVDEKLFAEALITYLEKTKSGYSEQAVESTQGQWDMLKTKMKEVGINIGLVILPALNGFLKAINSIPDPVFNIVTGILGLGGAIWIILGPILQLAALWAIISKGVSMAGAALGITNASFLRFVKMLFGVFDWGALVSIAKVGFRMFLGVFRLLAPVLAGIAGPALIVIGALISLAAVFQMLKDIMDGGWGENFIYNLANSLISAVTKMIPDWVPIIGKDREDPLGDYGMMMTGNSGKMKEIAERDKEAIHKQIMLLDKQFGAGAVSSEVYAQERAKLQMAYNGQEIYGPDNSPVKENTEFNAKADAIKGDVDALTAQLPTEGGTSLTDLTANLDELIAQLKDTQSQISVTVQDQTSGGVTVQPTAIGVSSY